MKSSRRALVHTGARIALYVAVAPAALHPCAAAAQETSVQVSDYPLAFVDLVIDGVGALALIDTGSSTALRLSSRLASRLKLTLTARPNAFMQGLDGQRIPLQSGQAQSVEVGGLVQEAVPIEVAGVRIETIAAQVGTAFDAVLGWGFMARQPFVLDYPKRRLRFASGAMPAAPFSGLEVAVTTTQGLPIVQGRVGDTPARLLVDTGAPMCNIDLALAGAPAGTLLALDLTLANTRTPMQWRVKDLSAQRRAAQAGATIGNNFLLRHVVAFQPESGIMRFG